MHGEARRLAEDNLGLAYALAWQLWRSSALVQKMGLEDARQAAALGVTKAARLFVEGFVFQRNGTRGTVKFSTFAFKAVRRTVLRQAEVWASMVAVPHHLISREGRGKAHLREDAERALHVGWFRAGTAEPLVEARGHEARSDDREHARHLLGLLDSRERRVVELRYWQDLNLTEIGRALGMSKARAEYLFRRALAKLKVAEGVALGARERQIMSEYRGANDGRSVQQVL